VIRTHHVTVEFGPAYRTCMDVLEAAHDALELIPEWNEQQRKELDSRIECLCEIMLRHLVITPKASA
jgi:hypothetical protein